MLYLYALCALLLAYAPSSQAKDLYYDHYLKTGINAGEMPMSVMLAQGFTEDHAPFKPINHTFYLNEHEHCDLGCKYNLYRMHFNKTTVATRGTLQAFEASLNKLSAFGELPEGWGLNHFSDMPHEEFQKLLTPSIATDGFLMVDPNDPDLVYDPLGIESRREKGLLTADDVPQSYSSISNNDVASIRNQGTCGSCYGFAGAAVAETTWSKMKGKLYTLSPMELAQCADMDGGEDRVVGGCHGGWTVKTLSYVKNNGIVKDSDYPYDMPYCLCGHCDETFHSECLTWPKLCPGDASKAALLEHDSKAEWYARGIDYYVLHDMQVKKNTTLTLDQQKEQLKINWCWPGRKCSSSNYGCCLRCIGGEIEERERARQLVNEHILKMEKAPEAQQQQQQQKIKISTESKPYVRRSLADTPGDEALPETFMLEDKDIDWNKIKQTTLALASDGTVVDTHQEASSEGESSRKDPLGRWRPKCGVNRDKVGSSVKFKGVFQIRDKAENLKSYLYKYGALGIAIDAASWTSYYAWSGTFTKCSFDQYNHAVVLVGYSNSHWIIRNSWGRLWGKWGYMYLKRRDNKEGMCGLEHESYLACGLIPADD